MLSDIKDVEETSYTLLTHVKGTTLYVILNWICRI